MLTDEAYRAKCQQNIKERSQLFNLKNTVSQIEKIIDN